MSALEHIIDPEKPAYQLMPWDALDQVGLVFAYGAHKHGEGAYRGPDGPGLDYCCGAAVRHLSACQQGERLDSESGLSHLAHAAARALIALHVELKAQAMAEVEQL